MPGFPAFLRNGLHHPHYIVFYSIYTFYYIIFSGKFQGVRPPERLVPGGRGLCLRFCSSF